MKHDLRLSKNLFVIPDGQHFILYEPRKPSVMSVNRATIDLLKKYNRSTPPPRRDHADVIQQMVEQGIMVPQNEDHKILFSPAQRPFNPQGVSLLLTAACSMRCIYCYSKGGDTPKEMPWPVAETAIDWIFRHARETNLDRIYVSLHGGGEVTVAGDLMKKCVSQVRRLARSDGIEVRIEAGLNGVMNREMTDWIIDHIDGATVSLDGMPDIQNAQRPLADGRDSSERVEAALKRMDERGFNYGIRMTVTQAHCHRMAAAVAYAATHFKPTCIQVEPVCIIGRAVETALPPVDGELFVEQFREAKTITKANGIALKYSGARLETTTNVFCKTATGDAFAITPEGHVTSCYEVSAPEDPRAPLFFFGYCDPTSGQISFDPQKITTLRTLSVENKPYCQKCFCKWHCAGDCPAKLAALGDAWNPDQNPRCYINQELTRDQIKELLR